MTTLEKATSVSDSIKVSINEVKALLNTEELLSKTLVEQALFRIQESLFWIDEAVGVEAENFYDNADV